MDRSYEDLIAIQREYASLVVERPLPEPPRTVAAMDMHIAGDRGVAAAVVMTIDGLEVVEEQTVDADIPMPYIPGLLSFREAPLCLMALERLTITPDLLLIDGHGRAHPRRCGIATHIGVQIEMPAIGVAKSVLTGSYDEPGMEKGSMSPLVAGEERLGTVVRTRTSVKPVFVSIGNLITLDEAVDWTLRLATRYRLPEPSHRAHKLAGEAARALRNR